MDDYLLQVHKPARYIGQEWNISKKDFAKAYIKFALSFPDLYEIGMSNLGLRIIYGVLNNITDVACERIFSCEYDMEQVLQKSNKELLSLESKKRLREFDIIGFSLGSELNYTNVLNILQLGAVPLQAALRDNTFPLVIGGGPCTLNPEPMHEFFDLFIIGEAEEALIEFIQVYREYKDKYKSGKINKQELLFACSKIEGIYVPSFYEVKYDDSVVITEFRPKIENLPLEIRKRFVKDLNNSFFPVDWLVPYIQIVHDRVTLEIMRGCPNKCRFCQARSIYFPLRERSIDNIVDLAKRSYKSSGYEEVSLVGLSVSEHSRIEELLQELIGYFKSKGVGLSLPSIKAKSKVGRLSSLIATIKKTGLTFAPEAGSERLRKAIGKDFNEEIFFQELEQSYSSGYRLAKLYFMIGLPFEEQEDLDGILDFSSRVSELKRKVSGSPAEVHVSINTLIPKPHTALQWCAMESLESIQATQDYLRNKLKNRRIKLSFHNPKMSFLEGILSRGDRRLSQVILRAFQKGARFDAWGNYFAFDKWEESFRELNIDPYIYLKSLPQSNPLAWDFIHTGVSKEALIAEHKFACLT